MEKNPKTTTLEYVAKHSGDSPAKFLSYSSNFLW